MSLDILNNGFILQKIDEIKGKGLITSKELKYGDIIFQEKPFVCCQFAWNSDYGYLACDHCMRPLESALQNARRLTSNPELVLPYLQFDTQINIVPCPSCAVKYCSSDCQIEAYEMYHRTLCLGTTERSNDHPLEILVDAWKKIHYPPETCNILLLARIVAIVQQSADPPSTYNRIMEKFCHQVINDREEIGHKLLGDRYQEQIEMVRTLFINAVSPQHVENWLTPDGFRILFALLGRNSQGVGTSAVSKWYHLCEDHLKLCSDDEKQQFQKFITQLYSDFENIVGTDFLDNEGSALYELQSACNHSCEPNAEPVFLNNNYELSMRVTRDIASGEEICISYIPECVLQRSRRTRQSILSDNYLFVCRCSKCEQQAIEDMSEDDEEEDSDDMEEE